jgi:hypothetical protein
MLIIFIVLNRESQAIVCLLEIQDRDNDLFPLLEGVELIGRILLDQGIQNVGSSSRHLS